MTITKAVRSKMFEQGDANRPQLIRMDQRFSGRNATGSQRASTIGWWTNKEHDKFLEAMELYPSGPWKKVAHHVGSRTARQVMTHAQKYRERIKRRSSRKPRGKAKSATSKVTKSVVTKPTTDNTAESASGIPELAAVEQPNLLEMSSIQDFNVLEPLPVFPINEILGQFTDEDVDIESLLLDELQQFIVPAATDVSVEPEKLNIDELMELLVDPAIDWTSSSYKLLS